VFDKRRAEERALRIEQVGARLRDMMSWIKNSRKDSSETASVIEYPMQQRSGAV
jgi:ketol-acid reductoisomerase